jgi:hypothetical protein
MHEPALGAVMPVRLTKNPATAQSGLRSQETDYSPHPGPTAFSRLTAQRLTRQAVRRLQDLGYQVTIEPRTDAA